MCASPNSLIVATIMTHPNEMPVTMQAYQANASAGSAAHGNALQDGGLNHTNSSAHAPQHGRACGLGQSRPPPAAAPAQAACPLRGAAQPANSLHKMSIHATTRMPPQLSLNLSLWVPCPARTPHNLWARRPQSQHRPAPLLCEEGNPSCWDGRAACGGPGLEADRKPGHPRCWVAAPPPCARAPLGGGRRRPSHARTA